ncbi:calpain-7-like [Actinia tenebrosa]|uniref:Calpain-7-like n=1 Tax=Actinia tenebrosa TaxID=6105 RepID=A0A6P8IGR0_ACTTE|nr:calpain-7-like [Actinia tenebrosa]
MADAEELCQDGYRFATQAIACDQKGSIESAIFFYIEAASSLERALSYNNTLDVRDKALQYVQRAEVLRLQAKSQQQYHGPLKTSQQNNLEKAEFLLKQGLCEDEKDKHTEALPLYTDAVQLCLDISKSLPDSDPLKAQFNNLAKKALERAEDIKRMQSTGNKYVGTGSNEGTSITRAVAGLNFTENNSTSQGKPDKGKPKYTPEEIAVLRVTSKINGKMYVPWNDIDLKERFAYPVCFTDKDGPLALSPKQRSNFEQWVRPTDIYEDPEMIYAISSFSVKQTVVSDCSFISSLAISAAYERDFKKRLVTSIIYPQNRDGLPMINPSGKYMIKLWLNGTARKVIIDDTLPMGKDGTLQCAHSTNRNEMWVSLIEKAYMKVMGGYDFPGSNSSIDLHALTGWIPERMSIKKNSSEFNEALQFDRLMKGLRHGDCLITVATGNMSDIEADRAGLVPTHAYAVLDMRKVMGHRLLLLKNPWSHLRWKGKFSERDESSWTPELQRALNYDRKSALQHDNGVFWIAWETLLHFYEVIYMNWNPKLFAHRFTFHSKWEAKEGPVKDAYNIGDNPQYRLEVNSGAQSAVVWILLTRHITKKEDFAENKEFITVHVYKTDGKRVYYPDNPYQEGTKINSPFYLSKLNVPAGKQRFTLIVSQYEKTNTIYYTLKVFSSSEFRLSPVVDPYKHEKTVKDSWTAKTAGGCPNYPTFSSNPVYSLELKSPVTSNPAEVFIKMLAPKQFSIGVMLRSVDRTPSGKPTYEAPFESYRPGFFVMQLSGVPAGSYQLIPSTFLPKQEGPYFLTVAASCNFSLTRL